MSCLYALIFLSNFDHTHSFTLSPTWLFYVHSWCDFMPCDIPVLDCLIYFSHLSIWGHHKKGENELSDYGGVWILGEFWNLRFIINLVYMPMFIISFQTWYVTWYLLYLMCVGTSLIIPWYTPWWEKREDSWRIEEQTMQSYSLVLFQFWVHGRVDLYRQFHIW